MDLYFGRQKIYHKKTNVILKKKAARLTDLLICFSKYF